MSSNPSGVLNFFESAMSSALRNLFYRLCTLLMRLRYRFSLPGEVLIALGLPSELALSERTLAKLLSQQQPPPKSVWRYMPRVAAERQFALAWRCERFPQTTLCSFFLPSGWLEISLTFDDEELLRRLYVRHPFLPPEGIELPLHLFP